MPFVQWFRFSKKGKHTYEPATAPVAPPESAADVRRMVAETKDEVKAGRMDSKVANTVAYVGTALLRAYEADRASTANKPAQSYVHSFTDLLPPQ